MIAGDRGGYDETSVSLRQQLARTGKADRSCSSVTVQFDLSIEVHIEGVQECISQPLFLQHDELQKWTLKPWKLRNRRRSSQLATSHLDDFHWSTGEARFPTSSSFQLRPRAARLSTIVPSSLPMATFADTPVSAPLSSKAVLSFPECHDLSPSKVSDGGSLDHVAFMQVQKPASLVAKNDPTLGQQGPFIHDAAQGLDHAPSDSPASEGSADTHRSDESSPEDSAIVHQGPSAADEVVRQDVMLYHLNDPPIRAFLNWNSFDEMMVEIAHHFAVHRSVLLDAYEVVAQLPDIGPDVVPIVVHMVDDIPPAFNARLVLIDLEYHGHQVEEHFQLGPILA